MPSRRSAAGSRRQQPRRRRPPWITRRIGPRDSFKPRPPLPNARRGKATRSPRHVQGAEKPSTRGRGRLLFLFLTRGRKPSGPGSRRRSARRRRTAPPRRVP
jgi:hypothetical protein